LAWIIALKTHRDTAKVRQKYGYSRIKSRILGSEHDESTAKNAAAPVLLAVFFEGIDLAAQRKERLIYICIFPRGILNF